MLRALSLVVAVSFFFPIPPFVFCFIPRVVHGAVSPRMAREASAEADRVRQIVSNATTDAERDAAEKEATAAKLAGLEREAASLDSPEEGECPRHAKARIKLLW